MSFLPPFLSTSTPKSPSRCTAIPPRWLSQFWRSRVIWACVSGGGRRGRRAPPRRVVVRETQQQPAVHKWDGKRHQAKTQQAAQKTVRGRGARGLQKWRERGAKAPLSFRVESIEYKRGDWREVDESRPRWTRFEEGAQSIVIIIKFRSNVVRASSRMSPHLYLLRLPQFGKLEVVDSAIAVRIALYDHAGGGEIGIVRSLVGWR